MFGFDLHDEAIRPAQSGGRQAVGVVFGVLFGPVTAQLAECLQQHRGPKHAVPQIIEHVDHQGKWRCPRQQRPQIGVVVRTRVYIVELHGSTEAEQERQYLGALGMVTLR